LTIAFITTCNNPHPLSIMMSTAEPTSKKIITFRFSEDFSTGPNRHIRSTSVFAPLIWTRRDAATDPADKGVLSWIKADSNTNTTLETLDKALSI
jgi:hypothetical protein